MSLIEGKTGPWEVVIGLEVHAQVISQGQALLRRRHRLRRGAEHAGLASSMPRLPGMLPVLEPRTAWRRPCAPASALKAQDQPAGRASTGRTTSIADLPQGYQISQFAHPIVGEGAIDDRAGRRRAAKTIGIERLHLEQDAGKSLHDQHPTQVLHRPQPLRRRADGDRLRARHALAGGGRRLPAQAARDPALPRHLRRQHGGGLHARRRERLACAGRARARHALARSRTSTRSASSCRRSRHEARRQIEVCEAGGTVVQETRLFDAHRGVTRSHALQGGRARLPLLPRPRPAAAGARAGLGRRSCQGRLPELPDEQTRALRRRLRPHALRRRAC